MTTLTEPLVIDLTVNCSVAHAFRTFTARASIWWPRDHTVTGTHDVEVVFEAGVDGRIFERAPDGSEHDWGRVLVWEPPHRLVYSWDLGTYPANATEVEITFTPTGDGQTAVRVEHRGWDRLGAEAEARRGANEGGWVALLPAFAEACDQL